jgi:hypothetical protein
MTDVKIIGLFKVEGPVWDNGDRLIAVFDCDVLGFRLKDCPLILTSRGFYLAQAPKGECRRDGSRVITIIDANLRKAMAEVALREYQAMGERSAA